MARVGRVAADVRERWRRGEMPDLVALLAENPELKAQRSIFLDLAHEEFCRRNDAGEPIETEEFCRRFPSFQNSLCMLIEVARLLGKGSCFLGHGDIPDWPQPEESFLGYSLIAEIGRGSFARVFLATESALGDRLVVLKIAPHGGGEAEVAGRLQHPNIVPVYSIKEDPQTGFTAICMPYLGRATLGDLLDHAFAAGAIPLRASVIAQAVAAMHDGSDTLESHRFDHKLSRGPYIEGIFYLANQIADALAYTHARGICHRDLKPSNVLLSAEGRPLLLDFNLSAGSEVNAWRVGGTLPYMAPEQLRTVVDETETKPLPPDPRSDLFSLGVIVYQLLCGALPFGPVPYGSSIEQVAEQLLERQQSGPQPLRPRNRHVDRHLEALVESCLAFDPDDRPQSAGDLADSFRRQLTPVRRTQRWARNHPRRVLTCMAVMSMLILAGTAFLALRAPYNVRQYRQGMAYAEQGQWRLAAECFDRSLDADPTDPEALFARGRVRQKLGQYDMGAVDFYKAWKIKPTPELLACQGFCGSKLNRHGNARMCYQKALQSGFRSAGLLNNLGYECIQLNHLDEAERYLTEALKIDSSLQAANINLVNLHVHRSVAGESVTPLMLTHAQHAVETAPPSGVLYHYAATLFGRAGKLDSRWVEPAKKYMRLAVANHVDPRTIAADPELSYVREDPRIQALFECPASRERPVKPVAIVDPLGCDSRIGPLDLPSE